MIVFHQPIAIMIGTDSCRWVLLWPLDSVDFLIYKDNTALL